MIPLEDLEKNHGLLASSSFWLQEMTGFCDLRHHSNLCFHLDILLLYMFQISLGLSLTRTPSNPGKYHLKLSNVMTSANTLYPSYQKVTFTGFRAFMWTYFGEFFLNPIQRSTIKGLFILLYLSVSNISEAFTLFTPANIYATTCYSDHLPHSLCHSQQSSTFLAPGTSLGEDNFSAD